MWRTWCFFCKCFFARCVVQLLRVDDSLTLDLLQALQNMMLAPDEVALLEDYDGDRCALRPRPSACT